MIDPDAPSRASPTYAPIRHWLVGNVPGSALLTGNVGGKDGKGDTLSLYHAPGPPTGTGYHRYGQFVFEQPKPKIAFEAVSPSIAKWNYIFYPLSLKKIIFSKSNLIIIINKLH